MKITKITILMKIIIIMKIKYTNNKNRVTLKCVQGGNILLGQLE